MKERRRKSAVGRGGGAKERILLSWRLHGRPNRNRAVHRHARQTLTKSDVLYKQIDFPFGPLSLGTGIVPWGYATTYKVNRAKIDCIEESFVVHNLAT